MEKNEPTQSKYDAALAKYNTQLDDAIDKSNHQKNQIPG